MTNIPAKERQRFIGSSEVAALFGHNPYLTRFQLWHYKNGTAVPDFSEDDRTRAGNFLEDAISRWGAKQFGVQVRNVYRYIAHPKIEGFGCSLDRETVEGREPVEIKNVDGAVFGQQWLVEEGELVDAPIHILLQCQAQLACTGKKRLRLWVCVAGNRIYQMIVPARPKTIARIEKEVVGFWQSVEQGKPPEIDYVRDYELMKDLYANFGSDLVDLSGDNYLTELCHRYQDATTRRKEADDEARAAMSEILSKITPAGADDKRKKVAMIDGFRITSSYIGEAEVRFSRKPHRRLRVTPEKEREVKKTAKPIPIAKTKPKPQPARKIDYASAKPLF